MKSMPFANTFPEIPFWLCNKDNCPRLC